MRRPIRSIALAATSLLAACGATPELTSGEYTLFDFGVEKDACQLQPAFPLALGVQVDSDAITLTTLPGEATVASGTIDGDHFSARAEVVIDAGSVGGVPIDCRERIEKSYRCTIAGEDAFEGTYTFERRQEGTQCGYGPAACTSALSFKAQKK